MYIDLYYSVLEKLNEIAKSEDEVQEHAIVGMALPVGDSPASINNKSRKKKKKKKRTKSPSDHL